MDKKLNQARWNFHYETARSNYFLECFGDSLAIKEGHAALLHCYGTRDKLCCSVCRSAVFPHRVMPG